MHGLLLVEVDIDCRYMKPLEEASFLRMLKVLFNLYELGKYAKLQSELGKYAKLQSVLSKLS
jgi:hypothetical protein